MGWTLKSKLLILFQISHVTLTSIVRNRASNGAEGHCGLPFTVGREAALDRRKAVFLRDPVVAPGAAAQPAAGVASAADAAFASPAGDGGVCDAGVAAGSCSCIGVAFVDS